jgi:hypothetical protein
MHTATIAPLLSESPQATASVAARPTASAATTPINAANNVWQAPAPSPTSQSAHLHRLRTIQAICENQGTPPCFLTAADAQLALRGLARYFGPLFARRQLSLGEVGETLCWAAHEFGGESLVEDIIQALVARYGEEQYARRSEERGRRA